MPTRKQSLIKVKEGHIGSAISIQFKRELLHKEPMTLVLDVYEWVRPRWNEELINLQEQSMALYFNNASQLISYRLISTGNIRGTIIDVQLVVCLALHTMASKVILVHNHPSGKLEASEKDIKITRQVKAALELIEVFFVGPPHYYGGLLYFYDGAWVDLSISAHSSVLIFHNSALSNTNIIFYSLEFHIVLS